MSKFSISYFKCFFHFVSMKFHAFYDFYTNQIHLKLCHSARFFIPLVTPSILCFPCFLNISIPLFPFPCLLPLRVVLPHVSPVFSLQFTGYFSGFPHCFSFSPFQILQIQLISLLFHIVL